jgi:hypothetical protein
MDEERSLRDCLACPGRRAWIRGLCRRCYAALAWQVRKGNARWPELEATGQCRPTGKRRLPAMLLLGRK